MKKVSKMLFFLLALTTLCGCSSNKKSSKCTGETCRIGDHEIVTMINLPESSVSQD